MEDLNSDFALSRDEHRIIAKAFDDRRLARDESVARARGRLKQHEKMTVETFKDIKLRYSKEESQAEAKLLHVLNELFPPSKLQELLLCTIARKQYDFGRIEFIQRELKLEDSQVRIFAELPAFLLSQAFEQRKRLGVSKFDPALAAAAKARIDAARNTLTTEQFEVYAKAVGLIPRDVALAKFLKTCSDEKRKELAVYKPCTKILEQAK